MLFLSFYSIIYIKEGGFVHAISDYYPEVKTFNISSFEELKKVLHFNKDELDLMEKAYEKAEKFHSKYNPPRKAGEPYITHPLSVAYILAKFGADCNTICAGLLHDVVEDTPCTLEELANEFNEDIAQIVDVVTKINNKDDINGSKDATHRKILEGVRKYGINGLRAILVKLADRIHNIQTLSVFNESKRIDIANETMSIYVPLARRYGIYEVKDFLSDSSFYYLEPLKFEEYYNLRQMIKRNSKDICDELYALVKDELSNKIVNIDYIYKVKNLYGIYKQVKRGKQIDEIDDLVGMKFIVPEQSDCYTTLGAVHKNAKPIGRNMVDYIASPKPNGYQSLNTLVNYDHTNVQARIRTKDMEQNNRLGILSKQNPATDLMLKQMKRDLDKISGDNISNKAFVDAVEKNILRPEIGVIAPTGKVITINDGDTAYDYALKMKLLEDSVIDRVYVNGNVVDSDVILCEGDNIFILTKPRKGA